MANELNIKLTSKLDKPKSIAQINADIKAIEQKISTLKLSAKLAIGQSRKQIQEDITQLNKQRKQLYVDLKIRKNELKSQFKAMQKELNPKLNIDTKQAVQQMQSLNANINSTKNTTVGLAYAIKKALSNAGLVVSAQTVFYAVKRAAQTATEAVKEYDNAVKNLRIITNSDYDSARDLLGDYASQALDLKVDVSDVEAAAEKILRAGKSVAESNEIIKQSIMLSKTGFISAEEAAENLVVISNAYNLPSSEIEHLNDVLVKLDSETNTTAGALVEAMATSAKNAELCNMSYEDLAATIAKLKNVTSKSENQISTSLNRILNRIYRVKLTPYEVELEDGTTEDVTQQLSDVERMLGNVGVAVRNTKGDFRDFTEIMDDLTKVWDDLDEVGQRSTAFVFGGTQYTNDFINLVKSWGDIRAAAAEAEQATGVVAGKYNAYLDSIESKTATLSTTLKEWWNNVIPTDFLSNTIDATTGVVKFADATRLLQTVLKAALFYGMAKGFIAVRNSVTGTVTNLSNFGAAMALSRQQTKLTSQQMTNFSNICKGLTAKQLMAVLSTNNLTTAEKQQIITSSNLTREEKRQMLATVAVSGANTEATATTISFSTAVKGLWATIKANPLGFIATLISILTTGISYFNDKKDEEIEKAREAAEAAKEEISAIKELYTEYSEVSQAYKNGEKSKEDLIDVTDQLLEKLGYEKTTIEELIEKYGDLDTALNSIMVSNLSDKIDTLNVELTNSKKALTDLANKYKGDVFSMERARLKPFNYDGWKIDSDFFNAIVKNGLLNVDSYYGEYLEFRKENDSIENILDNIQDLDDAISLIKQDFWETEYKDSPVYKELVRVRDELNAAVDDYYSWVNEINDTAALKAVKGSLLGREIPKTKEELEAFKQELIDTYVAGDKWKQNQFTDGIDEARKAIEKCLRSIPEFKKFFAEDLPSSTDKSTISVKKLTDAYEDLSDVLDDLLSKQDKLASLYEKIAKGTELSASEVYELIKLFPKLENHLIQVGSKWSFDIKGVNEAFDGLEDEFTQKAQEIIDNNKKIVEQSFDDYTKLLFTDFLKEKGITSISINSASDYEKYKNLQEEFNKKVLENRNEYLEDYKNRQEEANKSLQNAITLQQLLNSQINDFDFDVDNYNDKIKELMDASEKMAEGEALSYDELTSLIDKFPDLTYSGKDGEYFVEKSALDDLIEKSYEERNARIDDEIAKTYAVNEETANRIKAYEDLESEIKRLDDTKEENYKKYDENYDGADFVDGLLERFELEEERAKLIDELKTLGKEQYEADKALMESQSKYNEAYRKYLEALKEKLTIGSKDNSLSKELQNEIDYYDTIIKAIEAVTDKQIEALEDEKDALEKQKDALKDANDERQRELDLIEARNNLENAKKRKVYVYTEGYGFQQTLDKKAVKEAEEKLRDVELDIQEANIDKQIDKLDEQINAFEDYKKQFTDMKSDIEDLIAIEKAKNALDLDEQGLLNLPPETAKEIQEGLAEAVLKKDKEDNKGNDKFGNVAFDDFLKKLGTPLSSDEIYKKWNEKFLDRFSSPPEFLKSVAENISNKSEVYNNTNKKEVTFAPTINVYGVSNKQEVAEAVEEKVTDIFRQFRDSVI